MTHPLLITLQHEIESDNVAAVAALLDRHREQLEAMASSSCFPPAHIISSVQSIRMVDLFLSNGLTIKSITDWWGPGFGLNKFSTKVAEHLIQRGAVVTPHAAAALGLVDQLRGLLKQQPELVHAKGGDGARPLHFARNIPTASLLLETGAELDPRDDDHDSTPAQWRIQDAPDVTRLILEKGARADIFAAAALNDIKLARVLISENPTCTTYRIGNNKGPFPGIGSGGRGGTIYQWTLGFNQAPQEIAHHRGHQEMFDRLMSSTPLKEQFLIACMLVNRPLAEALVKKSPDLIGQLNDEDKGLLAKCCWETNLNKEAVRLMLDVGFPVDAPEFNHGFLPLHNAAWCGDPELVELLLQRGHPVDRRDPTYKATALGFAIHSCVTAKRHPEGDFPSVAKLLLEAGTPLDDGQYPSGDEGIDAEIKSVVSVRS